MDKSRKSLRAFSAALLSLILCMALESLCFEIKAQNHVHTGDDCPVCLLLHEITEAQKKSGTAVNVMADGSFTKVNLNNLSLIKISPSAFLYGIPSPVEEKTRLLS